MPPPPRDSGRIFWRAVTETVEASGEVLAARDEDGRLLGCAAWIRPGSYPLAIRAQLKQSTGALNALYPRPRALVHGTRYRRAIERVHPKEPMWYLAMLVVDPAVQRGASVRLCRTT